MWRLIQQLHCTFPSGVPNTHDTSGIEVFLEIAPNVVKICHDDVPVVILQVDGISESIRIACQNC